MQLLTAVNRKSLHFTREDRNMTCHATYHMWKGPACLYACCTFSVWMPCNLASRCCCVHGQETQAFWEQLLKGVHKPNAKRLIDQLDLSNPMGVKVLPGRRSGKAPLYPYFLKVKHAHPRKIVLVRVGGLLHVWTPPPAKIVSLHFHCRPSFASHMSCGNAAQQCLKPTLALRGQWTLSISKSSTSWNSSGSP